MPVRHLILVLWLIGERYTAYQKTSRALFPFLL
jgi:hypothetical protein